MKNTNHINTPKGTNTFSLSSSWSLRQPAAGNAQQIVDIPGVFSSLTATYAFLMRLTKLIRKNQ